MKSVKLLVVTILSLYGSLNAQSELELRKALEGKRVEVLIEMPASEKGIDLNMNDELIMDFDDYSRRLKNFGIGIYPGDVVMITRIKRKKKHIEIQLAGGGYGTSGDNDGIVRSRTVPKSKREKELEKEMKKEASDARKKDMQKELDELIDERNAEQRVTDRDAAMATSVNQARIQELRLQSGSRFNIRFDRKVTDVDMTIGRLKSYLSGYLNLEPNLRSNSRPESDMLDEFILRKGLDWKRISERYGSPESLVKDKCGTLEITTCTFHDAQSKITMSFVEDILVKYVISSN